MNTALRAMRHGALQKPHELSLLISYLQRRPKAETVLEIGTCNGGTLWLWCYLAAKDALIISLDLPGGAFGGGYDEQMIPLLESYARKTQTLELIRGDSHTEEALEVTTKLLGGREVDLLFIDGDHTYEGVKKDWEMYSPLVRPGGIVVFHDIVEHESAPDCQVDRLWNELKQKYRHEEFCSPDRGWAGIGVIHIG